jgi:hypothetical protein
MIFLAILLRVVWAFVVLIVAAALAVTHVPTVIANPADFWAWFWLALGASIVITSSVPGKA